MMNKEITSQNRPLARSCRFMVAPLTSPLQRDRRRGGHRRTIRNSAPDLLLGQSPPPSREGRCTRLFFPYVAASYPQYLSCSSTKKPLNSPQGISEGLKTD